MAIARLLTVQLTKEKTSVKEAAKSLLQCCFFLACSKVTHSLSPSPLPPSLSFSPSSFKAWLPSQSSPHPHPSAPTSPAASIPSTALAASQRLCCSRTRLRGLKLSTDVPTDKRRWSMQAAGGGGGVWRGWSMSCSKRSARSIYRGSHRKASSKSAEHDAIFTAACVCTLATRESCRDNEFLMELPASSQAELGCRS